MTELVKFNNGLRIIFKKNPGSKLASIVTLGPGGVRKECKKDNGIMGLMSLLIQRGTEKRNYEEISNDISMLGAYCDSFIGKNSLGFKMDCLADTFHQALEIYFDQLLNSVFPKVHVDIEKAKAIEELRTIKDNFDSYLYYEFLKALYGDHPYSFNTTGSITSLKRINRKEIIKSYRRFLDPRNLIVCVVGSFDKKKFMKTSGDILSDLKRQSANGFKKIKMKPVEKTKVVRKKINSNNAYIQIGMRGSTVSSDDRYALEVANSALSSYGGGRLYSELREKRGLVYSVYSSLFHGIEPGYLTVYLSCDPDNVERAIYTVLEVIHKMRLQGMQRDELERIKNYLIGSYEIELQRNSAQAVNYGLNELYGIPLDLGNYAKEISKITLKQANETIGRYFDLKRSVQVVLSP